MPGSVTRKLTFLRLVGAMILEGFNLELHPGIFELYEPLYVTFAFVFR